MTCPPLGCRSPENHIDEGGLAGAVRADQGHAVAARKIEGDVAVDVKAPNDFDRSTETQAESSRLLTGDAA